MLAHRKCCPALHMVAAGVPDINLLCFKVRHARVSKCMKAEIPHAVYGSQEKLKINQLYVLMIEIKYE